jgi:hypothetical protein
VLISAVLIPIASSADSVSSSSYCWLPGKAIPHVKWEVELRSSSTKDNILES